MMRCPHVGGISNRAPASSDYRQLKKITVLVRVLSCSLCRLNRYATYPSALPAESNEARHNLSGISNPRYLFSSQYCSVASNGILLLPRMNSTPSPRIHENHNSSTLAVSYYTVPTKANLRFPKLRFERRARRTLQLSTFTWMLIPVLG